MLTQICKLLRNTNVEERLAVAFLVAVAWCLAVAMPGCDATTAMVTPRYDGTVSITKENGVVTLVYVKFPDNPNNSTILGNREQVEAMSTALSSMVKDLDYAKEQMRVEEPRQK